jgi:hypothetical protein
MAHPRWTPFNTDGCSLEARLGATLDEGPSTPAIGPSAAGSDSAALTRSRTWYAYLYARLVELLTQTVCSR